MLDVDGAWDLHVHSSPDLFPRVADDAQVVTDAARQGFAGLVIKNHFEGTASRAALAARAAPGVKVYGGIVLNRAVGGVNPHAVEVALRLGARIVWMPTLDAECHRRAFGFGGGFPAQASGLEGQTPGIAIVRDGALVPEARETMALVRQHRAALATGHVSREEIRALVHEARAQGFRKLIVTHPYDRAPGLTLAEVTEIAAHDVRVEFVFCSITPRAGCAASALRKKPAGTTSAAPTICGVSAMICRSRSNSARRTLRRSASRSAMRRALSALRRCERPAASCSASSSARASQ